jgi:hypothetical protein
MLERTIARLKDATDGLEPPADFGGKLAARLGDLQPASRSRTTSFAVIALGRRALAVAAVAAAAALLAACVADRELDRKSEALVDLTELTP